MAKKKVEETKQEHVSLAGYVPNLQKKYKEEIVAKLQKEFGFATVMQVPKLVKITLNQGIGDATGDKKLVEVAQQELTAIAGQKAVTTYSRKDISNFKLRRGQAIGVKVTLRGARMYEFLERLIAVSLPRIRDFNGINESLTAAATTLSVSRSRSSSPRLTSTRSPRSSDLRLPLSHPQRRTRKHTLFSVSSDCLLRTKNRK